MDQDPDPKGTFDFKIYTDGSFRRPYFGAWAYVILDKDGKAVYEDAQAVYHTTNNRVELMAILEAISTLEEGATAQVFTDSQYAKNCCAFWIKKWKESNWLTLAGLPVANREILEKISVESAKRKLWFSWVRAHNGNTYNEMVDEKAQELTQDMLTRFKAGEPLPAKEEG